MDTKTTSETKIQLLEYHHNAMVDRRNIGFKAFISLITLNLIGFNGIVEISDKLELTWCIKFWITFSYLLLFVCYGLFIVQIEKSNRQNRLAYSSLADEMNKACGLALEKTNEGKHQESFWYTIKKSWAATWPLLAAFVVMFVCCLLIWCMNGSNPLKS